MEGRFAITANRTSNTVSLIDLVSGKVVDETPVGYSPFAVALAPDGKRAVVTNCQSNNISICRITASTITVERTLTVGEEPRGVAISRDGARAWVALAGEDAVVALDLKIGKEVRRQEVGQEPWHVALTPDGKKVVGYA